MALDPIHTSVDNLGKKFDSLVLTLQPLIQDQVIRDALTKDRARRRGRFTTKAVGYGMILVTLASALIVVLVK